MNKLSSIIKIFIIITLFSFRSSYAENSKNDVQVHKLAESDKYYLSLAIERINEKSQRYFGTSLKNKKNYDLKLLQQIFDLEYKRKYNKKTWQDMGVVLGEILIQNNPVNWVIYTDSLGKSRALQIKSSFNFLFPITMISRRAEAGIKVNIIDLYAIAEEKINKIEKNNLNNY